MKEEQIITAIIQEQGQIIGDGLAKRMALNSGAVKFNSPNLYDVSLQTSNPKEALRKIINSYKSLFGQASVEVCMGVVEKFYGTRPELEINGL